MKILSHIRNERGVALMMVLLIATITLAVTTSMLYLLVQSTRYSGLEKRISTSNEAAQAGVDLMAIYLSRSGAASFITNASEVVGFSKSDGISAECLNTKMNTDSSAWPAACDKDIYIDCEDNTTYDHSFELGNYDVYSKIVYTIAGNTQSGAGNDGDMLISPCVVHCEETGLGGGAIYSTYIVEIAACNKRNTRESTKLSILYHY